MSSSFAHHRFRRELCSTHVKTKTSSRGQSEAKSIEYRLSSESQHRSSQDIETQSAVQSLSTTKTPCSTFGVESTPRSLTENTNPTWSLAASTNAEFENCIPALQTIDEQMNDRFSIDRWLTEGSSEEAFNGLETRTREAYSFTPLELFSTENEIRSIKSRRIHEREVNLSQVGAWTNDKKASLPGATSGQLTNDTEQKRRCLNQAPQ